MPPSPSAPSAAAVPLSQTAVPIRQRPSASAHSIPTPPSAGTSRINTAALTISSPSPKPAAAPSPWRETTATPAIPPSARERSYSPNANSSDAIPTVTVATGARLNLTHAATDIVGTLVLGAPLTSVTFSAATHGAFISGNGVSDAPPQRILRAPGNSTHESAITLPGNPPGGGPRQRWHHNILDFVLNPSDVFGQSHHRPAQIKATDFEFTYTRRKDPADCQIRP